MKKLLILFISIYLFAFNSNKIETTILNSTKINGDINQTIIQKGLTGYVIQNNMMIGKAISLGNNKVKYIHLTKLKNKALATPKVNPKKGDKIIFGLYNFRGLIIAPNQKTYIQTKNKYPNITFISSDIFASYFSTKPELKDFQNFCSDFNVGIVDFILDKEYFVDCNSFQILDSKNIEKISYKQAFYTNYEKLTKNLLSSTPNNWINYYKNMLKGK